MSIRVRPEKAAGWVSHWKESFKSLSPDPTSVKTVIYLTLLEGQGKLLSYQEIADELSKREMLDGEMTDFTPLRNGMAQITKALAADSLFELESRKKGKESLYRLKRREGAIPYSNGSGIGVVTVLDDPELTALTEFEFVTKKLFKHNAIPSYAIYLPMLAAARWVLYSEGEAQKRGRIEGEECMRLLGGWLDGYVDKEISLIGLGVGEGIGEIEILERLLNGERHFGRIHYCAIDTNIHLLMDHVERLRHRFKEHLNTGRLACGVIAGNFLEDFPKLITRLQNEFEARTHLGGPGANFLPKTGTLVSILGNVVGNLEEKSDERKYFDSIRDVLGDYDLALLVGVSVWQEEKKRERQEQAGRQEKYNKDVENLLLATPRYLTHELNMIRSHQPTDGPESDEEPEFFLPDNKGEKEKRWPADVAAPDYFGAGPNVAQVTGKQYQFYYRTRWDLTMGAGDDEKRIPAGSYLMLYNIIKFEWNSLIRYLESRGLFSCGVQPVPHLIPSGDEERLYVLLAMLSRDPQQGDDDSRGQA
jgi:hypothetical protein